MIDQTNQLKREIEQARGNIYQMLFSDPSPELAEALERGDNKLRDFLEVDYPLILKEIEKGVA